jgi:hypothetical protein
MQKSWQNSTEKLETSHSYIISYKVSMFRWKADKGIKWKNNYKLCPSKVCWCLIIRLFRGECSWNLFVKVFNKTLWKVNTNQNAYTGYHKIPCWRKLWGNGCFVYLWWQWLPHHEMNDIMEQCVYIKFCVKIRMMSTEFHNLHLKKLSTEIQHLSGLVNWRWSISLLSIITKWGENWCPCLIHSDRHAMKYLYGWPEIPV